MILGDVQRELKKRGLDGWLFCDFHNRDLIAYSILGIDTNKLHTRRWYYFIPADGEPRKLVHAIESDVLDNLPGFKSKYSQWQQLQTLLKEMVMRSKKIAMQYSPMNAIPYISLVDGGTIDLIRSFGVEVVTSADLVQIFEAYVSEEAFTTHCEAGKIIHKILDLAWSKIKELTLKSATFTEYDIQQFIIAEFNASNLTCEDSAPIVAVNENSGNPHYEPTREKTKHIKPGDLVLIDLWAKFNKPDAVYFDITWTGCVAETIPEKYREIFEIVRSARDAGANFIKDRLNKNDIAFGYQVDDVVRNYIVQSGYGNYFTHRTGHSIGTSGHGNGANIDNLETKDERMLMPGSLFSIEPGIYLQDFGIRSEINMFINEKKEAIVTGPKQEMIIPIMK
jgi:Xaa-Pro aminopeptidase